MQLIIHLMFAVAGLLSCVLYLIPDNPIFSSIAIHGRPQQRVEDSMEAERLRLEQVKAAEEEERAKLALLVDAENVIDFRVNNHQYYLPLQSHDPAHIEERARLFCTMNGASMGIPFAQREYQCVSVVSKYLTEQIHPGMVLQMEFTLQRRDQPARWAYEVLFDPSRNTIQDVAESVCGQKALDLQLHSQDDVLMCVRAMQDSLAVFSPPAIAAAAADIADTTATTAAADAESVAAQSASDIAAVAAATEEVVGDEKEEKGVHA